MKRQAEPENRHKVESHYTYFAWCKCNKCKHDFKRENGFKWLWFGTKELYLCGDCSQSDFEYAKSYVQWMYDTYWHKNPPAAP